MTEEEHNKEAQKLLKYSDIRNSLPAPWKFEWTGKNPPMILDRHNNCIAILSTGTIQGAYNSKKIIANAKRLLSGAELTELYENEEV